MSTISFYKILSAVGFILLIPFMAAQLTTEVKWGLVDYIIAGSILFVAGVLLDLILKKINKPTWRILAVLTLVIVVILIWVELAVGIFNSPISGN